MANDSVLEIVAYGAWNGGTVVDNTVYGDDALATALRTNQGARTRGRSSDHRQSTFNEGFGCQFSGFRI